MLLDDEGVRFLAAAILLQAVKDYRDPKRRTEVAAFLRSRWGAILLDALGLDGREVRRALRDGDRLKQLLRNYRGCPGHGLR